MPKVISVDKSEQEVGLADKSKNMALSMNFAYWIQAILSPK